MMTRTRRAGALILVTTSLLFATTAQSCTPEQQAMVDAHLASMRVTATPALPCYRGKCPTAAQWKKLRHCEATGNYRARNRTGKYTGAYQFDRRTWASMGGTGIAGNASPAEQDTRAFKLYSQRGRFPWPHCGRHLR